jgi:hypothetical protein
MKHSITKDEKTKNKLVCKAGNKTFFKIVQIINTKKASRLESAVVGCVPVLDSVLR